MAGTGKTTLAASYVTERDLTCLWYRIDPEDNDLASFFHYLALTAHQAIGEKFKPLPNSWDSCLA